MLVHLIPMLRTRPRETRSSIARQVVSKEMVVSMSSTPSSSKALSVVPTPALINVKVGFTNCSKMIKKHGGVFQSKESVKCNKGREGHTSMLRGYGKVNKVKIQIIQLKLLQAILARLNDMSMVWIPKLQSWQKRKKVNTLDKRERRSSQPKQMKMLLIGKIKLALVVMKRSSLLTSFVRNASESASPTSDSFL